MKPHHFNRMHAHNLPIRHRRLCFAAELMANSLKCKPFSFSHTCCLITSTLIMRLTLTSASGMHLTPRHSTFEAARHCSECVCVCCICWRPSLNLPALIEAERRTKVNSSAGLMDGDKDDSQMESAKSLPGSR